MSQEIIRKYHIQAKKSLWQNFLVDENILETIALSIDIKWKNIVELWPWYGALTEKILQKNPQALHLVEIDSNMIDILNDREYNKDFHTQNIAFKIFKQDILTYIPEFKKYSIVANIPYYITSPILRHLLYDVENSPEEMLILMQKDVADKILWKGKNKSSVLSLIVDKKCRVKEKIFVPRESFLPSPKIDSSVIYFKKHDTFNKINDEKFLKIIKKWFLSPRKKLIKNLVSGGYNSSKILDFYSANKISENMRGEDLSITLWCKLSQYI